jgi:hypothetical protein
MLKFKMLSPAAIKTLNDTMPQDMPRKMDLILQITKIDDMVQKPSAVKIKQK